MPWMCIPCNCGRLPLSPMGNLAVRFDEVGGLPVTLRSVSDLRGGKQLVSGRYDSEPWNREIRVLYLHRLTGTGEQLCPMPRGLLGEGAVNGGVAVSGDHLRELADDDILVGVVDEHDDLRGVGSGWRGESDEGGRCHRCRFLGGCEGSLCGVIMAIRWR